MPAHTVTRAPADLLRLVAVMCVVTVLAACASQPRAPVEDRSTSPRRPPPPPMAAPASPPAPAPAEADERASTYTVKRGDTLHQIALDTGLDYRELAAWNNIENVNLIRVGQVLRLTAPGEPVAATGAVTTAPLRMAPSVVEARPGAPSAAAPSTAARNTDNYKSSPKAFKEPYSEQALRDAAKVIPPPVETVAAASSTAPSIAPASAPTTSAPAVDAKPAPSPQPGADGEVDSLDWVWPAKGKVVGSFSETANLKGIDIAGTAGQPVFASAAGTVVYAGTGLRGYGKLIIVKHNKTYLSAYAHNREILVKEGQVVTKGQKIAEMGNSDATEVKLHFEIRRLGKPMDPARYLPPA